VYSIAVAVRKQRTRAFLSHSELLVKEMFLRIVPLC